MAFRIQIPTYPNSIEPNKLGCVTMEETPALMVDPGFVAVYIGETVPMHRSLEITNGWMWLWASLRDKNLINLDQPTNGRIFAVAHIDHLTESNRRISWEENLPVSGMDIGIGISVESQAKGGVNQLQAAFTQVRDYAMENLFK